MPATCQNFQLCNSVEDALKGCGKGAAVMVGGFGLSGIPENTIEYMREQPEITDLKIISTEAGDDNWRLGRLYGKDKISKQWASYIGRSKVMEQAYLKGKTELELIPQGTISFQRVSMLEDWIPKGRRDRVWLMAGESASRDKYGRLQIWALGWAC